MSAQTQRLISGGLHCLETEVSYTDCPYTKLILNSVSKNDLEPSFASILKLSWGIRFYMDHCGSPNAWLTELIQLVPPHYVPDGIHSDWVLKACAEVEEGRANPWAALQGFIGSRYCGLFSLDSYTGNIIFHPEAKKLGITEANYVNMVKQAAMAEMPWLPKVENGVLEGIISDTIRRVSSKERADDTLRKELAHHSRSEPALAASPTAPIPKHHTAATGAFKDILGLLQPLWDVYDIQASRERELIIRFLVASAARTLSPGCDHQWMLVLSGRAGCGKTSFGQLLANPSAPSVQVSVDESGSSNYYQKINRASIAIFDEIDTCTRKKDISALKSEISASFSSFREPYAKFPVRTLASHVFLATTNEETFAFDDGAEMRRLGIIRLKGGMPEGLERVDYLKQNASLLRAIGAKLYSCGYPFDIVSVFEENRAANQAFLERPLSTQVLGSYLPSLKTLMMTSEDNLLLLTTRNLWEILEPKTNHFHKRKAGTLITALEAHGWYRKRIYGSNGSETYWIPEGVNIKDVKVLPTHYSTINKIQATLGSMSLKALDNDNSQN